MGLLTFTLNVTLDGRCDHREMVANDEMLRYWTRVIDAAGAMLFGRRTYELMEDAWPQVARDPKASPANRDWAKKLEAKPKYVVSTTRRDFPWSNTHHVEGDLTRAVEALKKATPRGLLAGSPQLSAALQRLDLVDEYRFVVHPVVAGHGPFLFSGLQPSLRLKFVAATRLKSGIVALHYRRRYPWRRRPRCRQVPGGLRIRNVKVFLRRAVLGVSRWEKRGRKGDPKSAGRLFLYSAKGQRERREIE